MATTKQLAARRKFAKAAKAKTGKVGKMAAARKPIAKKVRKS
ncbi:hypothetical protein [Mycobacterium malmoense]|nr:hypothetical protein [Mycobacterium malmoense]